jgi:hypothetical protein
MGKLVLVVAAAVRLRLRIDGLATTLGAPDAAAAGSTVGGARAVARSKAALAVL